MQEKHTKLHFRIFALHWKKSRTLFQIFSLILIYTRSYRRRLLADYWLLIMDSPQKALHRYRHKILSLIVGVLLDKLHLEFPSQKNALKYIRNLLNKLYFNKTTEKTNPNLLKIKKALEKIIWTLTHVQIFHTTNLVK